MDRDTKFSWFNSGTNYCREGFHHLQSGSSQHGSQRGMSYNEIFEIAYQEHVALCHQLDETPDDRDLAMRYFCRGYRYHMDNNPSRYLSQIPMGPEHLEGTFSDERLRAMSVEEWNAMRTRILRGQP